jgi:hypothetical protein
MKVFVAAATSEKQYAKGMLSFNDLAVRDGDKKAIKLGTRGDMARMAMGEAFLASDFEAILLLDLDMIHPPDLIERLRAHDVDMVSGHYFRRHINPMRSVVSLITDDNTWPYPPLITIPDDGLHEIACTGFGCVLIKRPVVEAVMAMLPPGSPPFSLGPMPEETNNHHGPFGSDFNFFIRARRAGYKLWLDASLESEHACNIWLNRKLYEQLGRDTADTYWKPFWRHAMSINGINATVIKARIEVLKENVGKLEHRVTLIGLEKERLDASIMVISGQIAENELYLSELETGKRSDMYKISNIPVFETEEELQKALENRGEGAQGRSAEETEKVREKVLQKHAMEIVDEISGEEARP